MQDNGRSGIDRAMMLEREIFLELDNPSWDLPVGI